MFLPLVQGAIEALFDPGGFPDAISQVVEFGASDFTPSQDFKTDDSGGMEQENPFYANPLENFPHGNGFVNAAIAFGDDGAFVGLYPFFAAFLDFDPHADAIAHVNGR